jgi:cysteinyl-tRNA synthetase
VQAAPHVGHIRSGVAFDVLARWLRATGYEVTLVRNVTDIDDKILAKGVTEGRPWWAVAAHYEREFQNAYAILGCTPPTIEPRATGHITQMIELMEQLIAAGHAYAVDGDVYFDIRSYKDYGKLSGQKIDDLLPAGDSEGESRKKDTRDFALWKSAKPGEPAWPTPWGQGRPGWHIECSAMAHTYLGAEFDIHGGGLDLIFPHHENEIAQSEAAGYGFAKRWLHNAWVTTSGEKMSKSLGNSLQVAELLKSVRGIELRWYLGSAHYRSMLEFSPAALEESAVGFRRIENFLMRATEILGNQPESTLSADFVSAMNEDLAVPQALAGISEQLRLGNSAITENDKAGIASAASYIRGALEVLGCDPFDPAFASGSQNESLTSALDGVINLVLAQRTSARERKDFAASDQIRDGLIALGISIEDTAQGPRWSISRSEGSN